MHMHTLPSFLSEHDLLFETVMLRITIKFTDIEWLIFYINIEPNRIDQELSAVTTPQEHMEFHVNALSKCP